MGRRLPDDVSIWVRTDLASRYGAVLKEDLPESMKELLGLSPQQG